MRQAAEAERRAKTAISASTRAEYRRLATEWRELAADLHATIARDGATQD
jgi:hypothetical protein